MHWAESYGDGSSEVTRTVAVDAEENVIVSGGFAGEITIGTDSQCAEQIKRGGIGQV